MDLECVHDKSIQSLYQTRPFTKRIDVQFCDYLKTLKGAEKAVQVLQFFRASSCMQLEDTSVFKYNQFQRLSTCVISDCKLLK